MADDTIQQESLAQMGVKVNKLCTALLEWLPAIEKSSCDKLPSKSEISDQIERFELWAVNLGLYHTGHSSIDYRFRDSEPLFEYTFHLLQDAKNDLMYFREAVADNLDLKPQGVNTNFEGDENETSASDDEDLEAEEDLSSYLDVSLPQAHFASFSATIDRLYRLAFRVRNPAMRSGLSSAISYTEVDKEKGIDLIQQYAVPDHNHIIDLVRSYHHTAGVDIPPNLEKNYLVKRLAKLNTRRRQQFRYWKRRKAQFIVHSVPERVVGNDPTIDQKLELEAKIPPKNVHSSGLSEPATATALGEGVYNLLQDTLSVKSTNTFMAMTKGEDSDMVSVPRPPSIPVRAKEFECPFCFTICPRKMFSGKAWETHIFHDLRPYVCTYEDCIEGEQQYDRLSDWVTHETKKHRTSAKQRVLDDTSFLHNNCQEEIDPKRECPICPAKGINAVHIASHLQRIASFALPAWTIGPEADSGASREGVACPDSSSRHLSDNEDLSTDDETFVFDEQDPKTDDQKFVRDDQHFVLDGGPIPVGQMVCPGNPQHPRSSRPPEALDIIHACPICKKRFTTKQDLKRHLQSRNPPGLYGCPFCDYEHTRRDKVDGHVREQHPHENVGPGTPTLRSDSEQMFPESCICREEFNSWDEWFAHLYTRHRSAIVARRRLERGGIWQFAERAIGRRSDPIPGPEATPLAMGPTREPILGQSTSDISRSSPIDRAQEGAALTEVLRQEIIEKEDASKATH